MDLLLVVFYRVLNPGPKPCSSECFDRAVVVSVTSGAVLQFWTLTTRGAVLPDY